MALSKETGFTQTHVIALQPLPRKQVLHRSMSLHCCSYQGNRFSTHPCHCRAALTKETGFAQVHVVALQAAVAVPRRDFIAAITGDVHV